MSSEREKIATGGPCVIISSSGMLQGGPSAFYAARLAGYEKNAILITGLQDEESPCRMLQNLAGSTEQKVRLSDQEVAINCKCDTYSLSAHANRMQICGFIEAMQPRTVILVHGDADARTSLKESIADRDTVLIEEGVPVIRSYPIRKRKSDSITRPAPMMTFNAATAFIA